MLQDTIAKFKAKLKDAAEEKKRSDGLIAELEAEEKRLSARCKELVQQAELTSDVSKTPLFILISPWFPPPTGLMA